ncbi:MAG: hypothetical protein WCB04_08870 [Mycobacteriales bacterium]
MSKERARQRAVRQAELQRQRLERERRDRRRARIARLKPRLPRRRRNAKVWSRRTRTQRAAVFAIALAAIILTVLYVDSWPIRLAVFALVAIGTPALTTLAMGRSRG